MQVSRTGYDTCRAAARSIVHPVTFPQQNQCGRREWNMCSKRRTRPKMTSTEPLDYFVYLGWWGVILLFLYFLCTSFLYLLILRKDSPYYSTGLALLCTVSLYNTFDNMYAFTGLQFQLIYPLILTYVKFPSLKWGFSRFIKTNMSKP